MASRRGTGRRSGRRRRGSRLLWPALGLAVVGTAAVVLASRRRRRPPAGEEPPDRDAARDAGSAGADLTSSSDLATTWIAGPAGNLYVRDGGDAECARPPVLFVHGLAGNGGQWALQLDHLRRHRRVLALDLRGHGESDPAEDGAYDVDSLAADVAAVADHFALRRFVLVGHSLGAAVAIAYAGTHPERVAGLLLADPNGDQTKVPRRQMEPFLAALRADPLRELEGYYRQLVLGGDRDAAQWVLEDLRLTCEAAIPAAVASSMEHSPLAVLERWRGPLLSVISEMNSLPYSLHQLLPGMPLQVLRGTGHWLMLDRPEQFNGILDSFLDPI
jgi:pimeloyl-ACP methyl ester carboxylesterase